MRRVDRDVNRRARIGIYAGFIARADKLFACSSRGGRLIAATAEKGQPRLAFPARIRPLHDRQDFRKFRTPLARVLIIGSRFR
jgi:hypothetical protein